MINFKSILITTSDLQLIQTAAPDPNTKILYLGDSEGAQNFISGYKMIVAGPWIPDITVMESDLNGIVEGFNARYLDYLNQPESQMLLATVLTALYKGKNVILFFPPESNEFKYPSFLLNYIANVTGIIPTSPTTAFSFNPAYNDKIAWIMYYYNTIDPLEFILLTESMDINSLSKLIMDLGISVEGDISKNPKPLLDWIERYKQTMLEYKIEMQKPFMVGVNV